MVERLCQRPAQGCQQVGATRVCPQSAEVLAGTLQRLLSAQRAGFAAVPQLTSLHLKSRSWEENKEGLVDTQDLPVILTLLQRRLDGKSGLMSALKLVRLSSVPDGRLFRATSKAS